jgi:RNA polymerase sigma factor (sigma-70 family)
MPASDAMADPSTLSDSELVTACRAGHPWAWRALVHRYQRLIYTVARRAGLSEHDAADVLQACFCALLDQLDRIQQPERLQAWLVTIARRETLGLLGAQRRHPSVSVSTDAHGDDGASDDPLARMADEGPLPPDLLDALQTQHRLHRALATLDKRSRELLSALYLSDPPPSFEEIAQRLDMAPGSVGPTRLRALDKLRRALDALS